MLNKTSETFAHQIAVRNAARTKVAIFDLSDRTQIEITGSDRIRFLHGFTSNDMKRLKPGQGCETFVTNLKGKVVAHVFVFCTEKSMWLDGSPGQKEAISAHLGKYILVDDVRIIPHDDDRGELFVTGPLAGPLLQLDEGVAVGSHVTRESGGETFDVRRVDMLGETGFLLSIPNSRIEAIKLSLSALGVSEGSRELFEVLRIESGYPRYGIDITDDYLAQEVGRTKQCISFDKGCYLGQETIARLDALGHTNRELCRLRFETSIVPNAGSLIFDETGATEIGSVTSATYDLSENATEHHSKVIALGLLKRTSLKTQTPVSLSISDNRVSGRVL